MQLAELNKIIESHDLVLADVYADWCEPCKMLDTIVEELRQRLHGKVSIIKIDADSSEEIKDLYHIRSVPVLLLFRKGTLIWRMNGFMMADELEKMILLESAE